MKFGPDGEDLYGMVGVQWQNQIGKCLPEGGRSRAADET